MMASAHISLAVLAAIVLTPVQSAAQTFEEAVWTNFSIAAQLCIQPQSDFAAWAQSFRTYGFAERVEGNSDDRTHYFTAPADTVTVELYYGQTPDYCAASTQHLDVSAASQLLDQIAPRVYPGYIRSVTQGAINPTTGQAALCVRYLDPASDIGHVVGAASIQTATDQNSCADNGTSRIYSSYRV